MEAGTKARSNENAIANIGAEMGKRRLTQKRVAGLLGMSQAALSDRQRGVTPWTLAELDDVAELFGLDVAALVAPVSLPPFPRGIEEAGRPEGRPAEVAGAGFEPATSGL